MVAQSLRILLTDASEFTFRVVSLISADAACNRRIYTITRTWNSYFFMKHGHAFVMNMHDCFSAGKTSAVLVLLGNQRTVYIHRSGQPENWEKVVQNCQSAVALN